MSIRLLAEVRGLRLGPATILEGDRKVRVSAASRKAVLLLISSYADTDGVAWPGQEKLAQESELGLRTVRRVLASLEADGVIERDFRRRRDGFRSSDRIRISPAMCTSSPTLPAVTSPAMCTHLTGHCGRADRSVDRSVDQLQNRRPVTGAAEEDVMNNGDWGPPGNDTLPDLPTPPTPKAKTPKARPKLTTAAGLAYRFHDDAIGYQPGVPDAGNAQALRSTFIRWHKQGVPYEAIKEGARLFWKEFAPGAAPAWKVFITQSSLWIEAGKEAIYQRDLVKIQAEYRRKQNLMYAQLDALDPDSEQAAIERGDHKGWCKRNIDGNYILTAKDRCAIAMRGASQLLHP